VIIGPQVERETHKCPLNRPVEVPIHMAFYECIVLNSRYHAYSRSLEVESRILAIGIDWRGSDNDWGLPGSQELQPYANGTQDFNQPRLGEKFRIARSIRSGPLDHHTGQPLERNSDGSSDDSCLR